MSANGEQKVALVGLDAIVPAYAERFMAEGKMPNLKKLRDGGFWTELIPTVPAWTPNGWASIATGANSSTHGIEGFFLHVPGEDYDVEHHGFDSRANRAQFIWEKAVEYGKKALVFKYPGTWPMRSKGIVQVGGAGGYGGLRNDLAINNAVCYTTNPGLKNGTVVSLAPAQGWQNVPAGASLLLEAELPMVYDRPATPRSYWLLAYCDANGQPTAVFAPAKDVAAGRACLHVGEWSEQIHDQFPLNDGETEGAFRLKLLQLDPEGQTLRLYMSQNLPRDGYCQPSALDAQLWEQAGPPTEYSAMYYVRWGWINMDTQLEIYAQHAEWMRKAATFLLKNCEWDLYYSQFHPIDYGQHNLGAVIDPLHPDYDPAEAPKHWDSLGEIYRLADSYLGAVMDAVDENTVVVAVGDHGSQPYRWGFYANNLLEQHGLLHIVWSDELNRYRVDWSRTRAYAYGPVHISLNLKGRDPHGIVEPEEYESLREQIMDLLRDVKHEETGKYPVKVVMTREEAEAFGLYGDGIGDIIFFMKNGFDSANVERMGHSPLKAGVTEDRMLFKRTYAWVDMTSEHPAQAPWEKNTRTVFCLAGPGIKQGVARRVPTSIVNVASTISEVLGMPYPDQNEGQPMRDAFAG